MEGKLAMVRGILGRLMLLGDPTPARKRLGDPTQARKWPRERPGVVGKKRRLVLHDSASEPKRSSRARMGSSPGSRGCVPAHGSLVTRRLQAPGRPCPLV